MRIVFFGTSSFAVPILEALLKNYEVAAVVTQPDAPVGRKKILTPPPVKEFLETRLPNPPQPPLRKGGNTPLLPPLEGGGKRGGIEILQPTKLSPILPRLKELAPDLMVVAAYGKIIPQSIIDLPQFGCLNVHPSLLPKYRGPSPIQYTILNGDTETGVTLMKIDREIDHGPILGRFNLLWRLNLQKLRAQELEEKLAQLGAELLINTLPKYLAGEIKPQEQDHAKATFTKLLTKEDGHIDWNKSAEYIERMVRAFDPWPGSWAKFKSAPSPYPLPQGGEGIKIATSLPSAEGGSASGGKGEGLGEGEFQIIKIFKVRTNLAPSSLPPLPLGERVGVRGDPGTVFFTPHGDLTVAANPGALILEQVQPEGKKPMSGKEFLNGHKNIVGTVLQ